MRNISSIKSRETELSMTLVMRQPCADPEEKRVILGVNYVIKGVA